MPYTTTSTSLRLLSRQIFVIILGFSLLFAALGAVAYHKTRQSAEAWQAYRASHDRGQMLMSQLLAAVGYGGMIHDFKNYVLRGGDERFSLVQQRGGAALTLLDEMRSLHDDANDRVAIDMIAATVRSYLDKSLVVRDMRARGARPEEIDRVVKVDDMPALLALGRLEQHLRRTDASPRFDMLIRFRRIAGYGGIVHDIKNYILRRDAPRADRIEKAIGEAREVLRGYRSPTLAREEAQALSTLAALVDTFEEVTAQIGKMAAEGADAGAIDARVRWDDGPALTALTTLEHAQELQSRRDAATLDLSLAKSSGLALGLALAIALILPLIAWGILDQLKRRAVKPVQRISEAMSKLASGEVGPDVSALAGESAIGRIAAASQAFRVAYLRHEQQARDQEEEDFRQRMMSTMPW